MNWTEGIGMEELTGGRALVACLRGKRHLGWATWSREGGEDRYME